MKIKIYLTFVLFFIFSVTLFSAEKMRIVVMNLKGDGVNERTARTVTNMLRTEFINMGNFTVVERAQMDAILEEQGLQQSGCTDQECAVQIGKMMSAKKIMVGEVSPMGKSIVMTIRIVDVEKGISEFAASQKSASEDVLDDAVAKIARSITSKIEGNTSVASTSKSKKTEVQKREEVSSPSEKTMSGYYLRGFVPGWGQIYADRPVKGAFLMGGFVVSGILSFVMIKDYSTAKDEYESMDSTNQKDYDDAYQKYEDASKRVPIFLALTAGVYVLNWLDIFILSRPDYALNDGMQVKEKLYYSFDTYKSTNRNETVYKFGLGTKF